MIDASTACAYMLGGYAVADVGRHLLISIRRRAERKREARARLLAVLLERAKARGPYR